VEEKVRKKVISPKTNISGYIPQTDVEEQMEDGEALLKCFSPLLNSMRLFGLYFTRAARCIHDVSRSTTVTTQSETPKKWNVGLIYAVVILVVAWLNAARMLWVFEQSDKFGFVLLVKLATVSSGFSSAVWTTSCFVACLTGNLDRVFREAKLSQSDISRYRRLAIIHTVVCWVFVMGHMPVYFSSVFTAERDVLSSSMTPFEVHIFVPNQLLAVVKIMAAVIFTFSEATWFFSHSVNYMAPDRLFRHKNFNSGWMVYSNFANGLCSASRIPSTEVCLPQSVNYMKPKSPHNKCC